MQKFAPLLYTICWLLRVSAVICHHQGASGSVELRENTDRFSGLSYNVVKWPVCRSVVVQSFVLPSSAGKLEVYYYSSFVNIL
jgi:hypothetical protein